ncbi:DUF6309 family protein [Streptomyces sp. NPDC094448]|uniref:DUF6309 family protein n=1 Tax=Streptomyces sp. NPDC094448 TaxID=3366063 RepID=UPI0038204896
MRVLASVPFEHVLATFTRNHPYVPDEAGNTNDEAEENLCHAQLELGHWHHVRLDRVEVLDVVLPWHTGEYGETELIAPEGTTVAAAVARLRALGQSYGRGNPDCAARLAHHAEAPMTPVYLSARAVPGPDYERLAVREGLIHLDGLHRLLAWELSGRLAAGATVEAYTASAARSHVGQVRTALGSTGEGVSGR